MPMIRRACGSHNERGQVVVLFALLLPVLLGLGAIVLTLGNWFTHAKHLQTKVDAAALAGGQAWGFPCGADSDTNATGTGIVDVARKYVGPHTTAAGALQTTGFNPQVGGVVGDEIHVVVNGTGWWDDDAGSNPLDSSSPAGSVCEAKILDVKATEANSFPLFGVLPFFPDLKRKARLQIEESAGVTGLLPIAVRIPRPLSAAVVFYNEATDQIIDAQYLREVCIPGVAYCVPFAPAGLGQWTTEPEDPVATIPNVPLTGITGVVIASSFRAACNATGATPPCLNDAPLGVTNIDAFCNQNRTVTCWDATGAAGSQSVVNGVQFIRSYGTAPNTGTVAPVLRSAYFRPNGSCQPYVNSLPSTCFPSLSVEVDLGDLRYDPPGPATSALLTAKDVQVRYRIERADGSDNCATYGANCDLLASPTGTGTVTFSTTGSGNSPHPPVLVDSWGNAVSIEIRVRNTINLTGGNCNNYNAACRWYYTATSVSPSVSPTDAQVLAAPIQRSFMGSVDRTGPLRWLRLDIDPSCNTDVADRLFGWQDPPPSPVADAASRPAGSSPCYVVNVGLQVGMARDQDEPPVGLLLGSSSSQRALVDCDPDAAHGQVEDEIRDGCAWPPYIGNKFDDPPGPSGWCPWGDDTPGTFFDLGKPAPFDDWPAFDCVLTRTGNALQLIKGFNQRLFGVNNNPSCLTDDGSPFQPGRNYWHRANNFNDTNTFYWDNDTPGNLLDDHGTNFNDADKRVVSLFLTPYGSFTGSGNQVQELVGLGSFYITGYGNITGSGLNIEDPCSDGASFPGYQYTANEPPPDLDTSKNTAVIWGHFIKDAPAGSTGSTGVICQPVLSFNPCTPVLTE